MNKTETTLARIFAICDEVAETGETIRTEDQGRDDARGWLGVTQPDCGKRIVLTEFPENG